jgi:RNA polymerase sigma factor (sigma-70 family)
MTGQLLHDFLRHFKPIAPPGAGEWTDRQLVERFASQRDEDAFASLVRRHGPLVLGVGRRVLQHDQDAEDVFQATFLLLARHAASHRWQSSIAGWLYCVAYRLALRVAEQSVRRREVERVAGTTAAAAVIEDRMTLYRVLDEELQRLSDEFREPLVLCYLEGKTRDQAARRLGWSLRTLQRRLNQGLQRLRARLGKRGVELPLALLTAGLSQQAASASMSAAVVKTTIEATMSCGPGAATAGGVISPRVSALVEEGSRTMTMTTMTKTIIGAVVLLVLSATAVVGAARHWQPAAKQPAEQPVAELGKASAPVETTWPEGATVQGRVIDHRGTAVANAEVLLLGAERIMVDGDRTWFVSSGDKGLAKLPSARTDAKGEFSITRKKGTADRIAVISAEVLFWSVPRRSLAAAGRVEVTLPPPGRMAFRCALPGKAAKQPVMITLQDTERESDSLRFHSSSYSVKNPGETVFEHLPPGEYTVQREIDTPTGSTVLMTMADRQRVKVEAGKQATVRFERKKGRPITGRVRGLENVPLRYAHVTIMYAAALERFPGGKSARPYTAFDVLPIKSDGRFTTDPIPPGKYHLHLYAMRDSSIEQSSQQSDFDGFLAFTVPQLGEMPKLEVIAKSSTSRSLPNNDLRAHVVDDAGKALPKFQAMIHTASAGHGGWHEGRNGMVGLGNPRDPRLGSPADAIDMLIRADGYAPGTARFEARDREKLRQGKATITLKRGQEVELRFRLPEGLAWPKNTKPEAYFTDYEENVRIQRQPANRTRFQSDYNMLNLRPLGPGRFACRLADDTPPFHVAIHAPGFLQCFEAGPFTLASFKRGVLEIDVPRPASLDIRFEPAAGADALPFKGVWLQVMRQLHGASYLEVATDLAASTRHALRLTDLAPGGYLVSVRTQPKPESKQVPGTEINPGSYYERKKLDLAAGKSERINFGYTPFDQDAFRGKRTAVVRIRMPDGTPAKGRNVTVGWADGHYGLLSVFTGRVPASGEIRLEGLTDRVASHGFDRPYSVSVDGRQVGRFGFTKDQPGGEFEFRLAPQIGDMAPDVELTKTSTGKPVRLSSLRGKVVCLEFWATWCGPCQPAMAKLNGLVAEKDAAWKDRVAIVPVSIDDEPARVRTHALRRGWNQLDHHWTGEKKAVGWDAPAARAFVVHGVPETILIGSDGRILWRCHPMATEGGRSLEARINEALTK